MNNKTLFVILLSFIAFISLGMPDGLIGVAWPGISDTFNLPLDFLGMLLIGGTAGYMLSSILSPGFTRKFGVGSLLSVSCFLTGLTLLVYASAPSWLFFVIFSFFLGMGGGAIDVGINTYVAQNHSERLMHWLHASFGIGVTIGPVIMTLGIKYSSTWRTGYYIVGIAQILLALLFFANRTLWTTNTKISEEEHKENSEAKMAETFRLVQAHISMLMFILYTGVELGIGLWIYTLLTQARGVETQLAGFITSAYWGSFTVGRITAGAITKKIKPVTLLFLAMFFAGFGVVCIIINIHITITVAGVVIAGFSLAPIFPGLVSDTENRVGRRHQGNTIGMQLSAAGFGAAVLPAVAGILADTFGIEAIPKTLFISIILLILVFSFSHISRKKSSS